MHDDYWILPHDLIATSIFMRYVNGHLLASLHARWLETPRLHRRSARWGIDSGDQLALFHHLQVLPSQFSLVPQRTVVQNEDGGSNCWLAISRRVWRWLGRSGIVLHSHCGRIDDGWVLAWFIYFFVCLFVSHKSFFVSEGLRSLDPGALMLSMTLSCFVSLTACSI